MKAIKHLLFTILLIVTGFLGLHAQAPSSLVVTTNSDTDDAGLSLRKAIDSVAVGGTVTFDPSVFYAGGVNNTIVLSVNQDILIDKNITITGPVSGSGDPVITIKVPVTSKEANGGTASDYRIFHINSGTVNISNLNFKGGDLSAKQDNVEPSRGAAIFIGGWGRVTMNNLTFSESKARKGGAVFCDGGAELTGEKLNFFDNEALADGGAIYNSSAQSNISNSVLVIIYKFAPKCNI